jgi:hypothetical protein
MCPCIGIESAVIMLPVGLKLSHMAFKYLLVLPANSCMHFYDTQYI